MKTFNRTSLPEQIKYNGKVYVRGERTDKSIRVLVLQTRLKGRTDLWGHPYRPTEWYYNKIN